MFTPTLVFSRCFGACGPASLLPGGAASLPRGRPSRYFLGELVRVGASTRRPGAAKGGRRSFQASGCKTLESFAACSSIGLLASIEACTRPRSQRKGSRASILQAYRSNECAGRHAATPCYSAASRLTSKLCRAKTPPPRHTTNTNSSHGAPPANTTSATARRAGPAAALRAAALAGDPVRHVQRIDRSGRRADARPAAHGHPDGLAAVRRRAATRAAEAAGSRKYPKKKKE